MYLTSQYASPVGELTLCSQEDRLAGLWLKDQKYFGASIAGEMVPGESPVLTQARDWLDRYFQKKRPAPQELPLAPEGSGFRKEVWRILCDIPYGDTRTYGEIARMLTARRGAGQMSAQAVGGAVGHNPIAIVVPCHRVVGTSGSLTGYAGGLEKKIELLVHEGVDMKRFFLPKKKPQTV